MALEGENNQVIINKNPDVINKEQILIEDDFALYSVRSLVLERAREIGMHTQDLSELEIIVREMVSNILVHCGKKGHVNLGLEENKIILDFIDEGSGFKDVVQAFDDGFSTSGTMGAGLPSVQRLADSVDLLETGPGGSHIRVIKSISSSIPNDDSWEFVLYSRPHPMETENGDSGSIFRAPNYTLAVLADGLGHGPSAAKASKMVIELVRTHLNLKLVNLIELLHRKLSHSRGAAVSIAKIIPAENLLYWVGIGNVNGRLIYSIPRNGREEQIFMNRNGTIGAKISRVQPIKYRYQAGDWLALTTDGLKSDWYNIVNENKNQHIRDAGRIVLKKSARPSDDASILLGRVRA